MEFLAATKDGIIVYDMLDCSRAEGDRKQDYREGHGSDGISVKVVATVPSPPNMFGHAWSSDGALLASVCDEGVRLYDATRGYVPVLDLPKVAPDVGGRAGGVRTLMFSPTNQFMVTYEKWDPQYPDNVHCWALTGARSTERLYSLGLKGYTSGAVSVELVAWTHDEAFCLILEPGTGLRVHDGDIRQLADDVAPKAVLPERNASNYLVAPAEYKGANYVSLYTSEAASGGMVGRVAIYNINEPSKAVMEVLLPAKVKDCRMIWNHEGSALLVLASSDVDESGSSYFGTTYLYWAQPDTKKQLQIYGAKEGQVQDLCWSPTASEFVVVVGQLPATVALWDGSKGKLISTLGVTRRNTLKWNPFGRFIAVGGFGTLPGDLDFFDRSKEETISTLRAALTVNCQWAPDGRHFLCSTTAPRMNEGNQISIYKYTGERLLHMDYKPDHVEGRHEDTGAGARTKTQALLMASSWRPDTERKYQDRAASPPRMGARRQKGLPDGAQASGGSLPAGAAYRPRGEAGGSVAAMMRGELNLPPADRGDKPGWDLKESKPLEEWEIRKMERERAKEAERKAEEAKEQEKQAIRDFEKASKDTKKRIKELKAELAKLDELKDKAWDELTDEDEEQLEGEIALRTELVELEKSQQ